MADRETDDKVMETLTELRKEVEKKGFIDKDKVVRLEEVLASYEDQNQKLVIVEGQAKALKEDVSELKTLKVQYEEEKGESLEKAKELKTQINDLEAEVARGTARQIENDPEAYKETSQEYKSLNQWCIEGERIFMEAEHKALLRTDSSTEGGVLVVSELDSQITKKIVEIDPLRSISRVRTISGKSLELAIRNNIPVATYEGEAEAGGDTTSDYESETVTPFRQTNTTPITKDMLMNASFDMESELGDDNSQAFAFGEGNGFVVGDGHKQPAGFLNDTRLVGAGNFRQGAGTAGLIFEDDIILLSGDLKVGYNPSYVLNRRSLASIRTRKSTTGAYLWQPGLNGPVANTLNGFPYALANSMPDEAANAFALAFGDFRRGYLIVDRTGMSVVRDEVTQKRKAIVEFTMHRWNTGLVVLPEAIKVLKVKA